MKRSRMAAHKGKRTHQSGRHQNREILVNLKAITYDTQSPPDDRFYRAAKGIALDFLQDLSVDAMSQGSDVARDVYNAVRNRDFATLVNLTVDPARYTDAASFKRDYQLVSLLRKSAFLETGIDRKGRAIEKWCAAERQCGATNDYIESQLYGPSPDPCFLAILQRMRDFIARVLGKAPKLSQLDCRFGPGATQLVKRGITLPKKYSKRICCAPGLAFHVSDVVGFHWNPTTLLVVDGNSLSFVPKDARTDRSICIEPDLNIYVQLGIGKWMRKQFRRYFDLDSQADRNREMVKWAQACFATIDLSSASDTIASSLVHALLPEDWYDLLDMARCRYTVIDGQKYENQKFSSMGNGFTFELETLIFYAACCAVGVRHEDLSVFGDDIIVPQADAMSVTQVLQQLGFTVNEEKTFLSGSFFESCGHDYFNGTFVRPFFWKVLDAPVDVIKMCNDVSRMAKVVVSEKHSFRSAHVYRKTHSALVRLLKIHGWYTEVPEGYGDIGVIVDLDSATPKCDSTGYLTTMAVRWESKSLDYSRKTNAYVAALDRATGEDIVVSENGSQPKLHAVRGEGKWVLSPFHVPAWNWNGFGRWID